MILTIDGNRFSDIGGFYAEINRVFMAAEDWQLGESLDALEDLLGGGYGAAMGAPMLELRWLNMAASRDALGVAATQGWLRAKLSGPFDAKAARARLEALDRGEGETYFDIVQQIIAAQDRVRLVPLG